MSQSQTSPKDEPKPTSMLIKRIRRRLLRRNQNWLAVMTGSTGTGKSSASMTIAKAIDPTFDVDRVVFTPDEFMQLINSGKLRPGNMIIFDEAGVGVGARDWYKQVNKSMSYVLQTFRHQNYGVIFTVPNFDLVDSHARRLFHSYFETMSINYGQKLVRMRMFELQYNALNKTLYKKYPVVRTTHGKRKITSIFTTMPDLALWDQYEMKKQEFTKKVNLDAQQSIEGERKKKEGKEPGKRGPPATRAALIVKYLDQGLTKKQILRRIPGTTLSYIYRVANDHNNR